ncbi:hypothetical protein JCM6882_008840 [Rhodosporidiobolus microsporus]
MSTSILPMARDTFVKHEASGDHQDFMLQGVFIHPDHLAQGFFADEPSSSSSSETSSIISYDDDEPSMQDDAYEPPTEGLTGLALTCGFSSEAQEVMHDYFAPRPGSSNPSPFYSDSAASSAFSALNSEASCSSAATTPTCEASSLKSPDISRRSSYASVYSEVSSPAVPAISSFATFAPNAPRAPSPSRSHPYTRPSKGGAAMSRSVSSPVETQRQVEERKRAMSLAAVAIDDRTVKMNRTKSSASTPTLGSFPFLPPPPTMTRSATVASRPLFSPLSSTFGEDWGAALPPRELPQPALNTFPYTVARPPVSPYRTARAHSFAGTENMYTPPPSAGALGQHRNSLPTASLSFGPSDLDSPPSPTLTRQARRRSRHLAFTPILPQFAEQASSPEMVPRSLEADVASPSAPLSPSRNRLHRGFTF